MNDNEQDNEPLTLAEQLTINFYNWERRGRGWNVWGYPVELEPPYVPFFHTLPFEPEEIDDGRKPTFLSSIADKFQKKSLPSPKESQPALIDYSDDIVPSPSNDNSTLSEISITLLPHQKITFDSAEQFLLNLSNCSSPLSFEIIGTKESISVRFTCRSTDLLQLRQQVKAYFPDSVLSEEIEPLENICNYEHENAVIDFGLSHEFMRPLRTFIGFDPDPLIGIIGAMEDLEESEVGVFQILFQAVRNPWTESIQRSVIDYEGNPFFVDSPEMVHLAKEKIRKPLFGAVIRVAGQSLRSERAWDIAKGIGGGLTQLANPQSNELIPLTNDDYDDHLHWNDLLARQTHRSGMILNSEELVSLLHLPSMSVRASKLSRETKKTKPVPDIATGHNFIIGENVHQGKRTAVTLSTAQRLRHMYLIGATGTGKSTLLLNQIVQDIESGLGVAVLDPHGDLIDRIIGHIPEERHKDVVLLDPSDSDWPVGLNILTAHSKIEKTVLSSDLVAAFKRLSTSWGDQMTSVLGNAVLAFLESNKGGTLVDLRHFLVEPAYRKTFLETVKDQSVVYYWQKEFPLLTSKPLGPILTRLDTFLRPKLIRNMVAQKNGLIFEDILNNKKIFLAKLSHGLIGEENSYLLGSLIVSKIQQAAMARQSKELSTRDEFYMYIDEFHNFITPSMASILSGARKYGLGLVLAHQELRQLWNRDTEIGNSVISNPCTRICFRLGDFDAKKLEDGFSTFDARDLQNLGVGEALCRIERNDYDFNLKTTILKAPDSKLASERRDRITTLSRERYAVRKDEVEKIIEKALTPVQPPRPVTPPVKVEPPPTKRTEKTATIKRNGNFSSEEICFLKFLSKHPDMFVTQVYKELELSGYKGDKLKGVLMDKGLITQEETRKGKGGRLAKVLSPTDKGFKAIKDSPLKGKGGDAHRHLQLMIKEQAELYGWKATIEERIPGSLESVDIGLKKGDLRVAIEVSATSRADYEVQNIRKCLDTGYDYIISVSSDSKQLSTLKTAVRKAFTGRERERIRFSLPPKVKDLLHGISPTGIVSENGVVSGLITGKKELMGTKEASELLDISRHTLYEWVVQRKVPFVKVGSLTKFRRDALEKWLDRRSQEEDRRDFLE